MEEKLEEWEQEMEQNGYIFHRSVGNANEAHQTTGFGKKTSSAEPVYEEDQFLINGVVRLPIVKVDLDLLFKIKTKGRFLRSSWLVYRDETPLKQGIEVITYQMLGKFYILLNKCTGETIFIQEREGNHSGKITLQGGGVKRKGLFSSKQFDEDFKR